MVLYLTRIKQCVTMCITMEELGQEFKESDYGALPWWVIPIALACAFVVGIILSSFISAGA